MKKFFFQIGKFLLLVGLLTYICGCYNPPKQRYHERETAIIDEKPSVNDDIIMSYGYVPDVGITNIINCENQSLMRIFTHSKTGGLSEQDMSRDTLIFHIPPDFCDSVRSYLMQTKLIRENHRYDGLDNDLKHSIGLYVIFILKDENTWYGIEYMSLENYRDLYHKDSFAHKAGLMIYNCYRVPIVGKYFW